MNFGLKNDHRHREWENMDNNMEMSDRRMQNYIVISINSFGLVRCGVALELLLVSSPSLSLVWIIHILFNEIQCQQAQETDLNFAHSPTIIIKMKKKKRKN